METRFQESGGSVPAESSAHSQAHSQKATRETGYKAVNMTQQHLGRKGWEGQHNAQYSHKLMADSECTVALCSFLDLPHSM